MPFSTPRGHCQSLAIIFIACSNFESLSFHEGPLPFKGLPSQARTTVLVNPNQLMEGMIPQHTTGSAHTQRGTLHEVCIPGARKLWLILQFSLLE